MSCPGCIVALSGPEGIDGGGFAVRRSIHFGDEPTQSPTIGSLGIFALSGIGAYLLLSLVLPASAKHLARSR
jgi:hypothetical protein